MLYYPLAIRNIPQHLTDNIDQLSIHLFPFLELRDLFEYAIFSNCQVIGLLGHLSAVSNGIEDIK